MHIIINVGECDSKSYERYPQYNFMLSMLSVIFESLVVFIKVGSPVASTNEANHYEIKSAGVKICFGPKPPMIIHNSGVYFI